MNLFQALEWLCSHPTCALECEYVGPNQTLEFLVQLDHGELQRKFECRKWEYWTPVWSRSGSYVFTKMRGAT